MELLPSTSVSHAILNGAWELELTHPIDDEGRWKYIVEEAIIKMPTAVSKDQLYRIYSTDKDEDMITANARPVFLDAANEVFLEDVRPTGKNGQQALDIMLKDTKYSGKSNITKASTAYYIRKNFIEALSGNDENAFLKRWGGEIRYDNYSITVNDRLGGDYGVEIVYGKNLKGIHETVDMSEVVTRIKPVAYNGYTIDGYVDSPLIKKYAKTYYKEIPFEDVKLKADASEDEVGYDTEAELQAELRRRCQLEYDAGIDKPKVTIEVEMEDISKSDIYKDYKLLETVNLGDTVHCKHHKLGIITDARVIELEWDNINNCMQSLKLGDTGYNYFSNLTNIANTVNAIADSETESVRAIRVKGILDATDVVLMAQKQIAQKQDIRAMYVEDLDPDSPTYGYMGWGTKGLEIADKRTSDGRGWESHTAITAKGVVADTVITGLLADKTGRSYWNMDTGDIHLDPITKEIGSQVQILDDKIATKVTSEQATSLIEQKASSIRMLAEEISWKAKYSSMTQEGKLTCQDAEIRGEILSTQYSVGGMWVRTSNGAIEGGDGSLTNPYYGRIEFYQSVNSGGVNKRRLRVMGRDWLELIAPDVVAVKANSFCMFENGSSNTMWEGANRQMNVVTNVETNDQGMITRIERSTLRFVQGVQVIP